MLVRNCETCGKSFTTWKKQARFCAKTCVRRKPIDPNGPRCSISGCPGKLVRRARCKNHYYAWLKENRASVYDWKITPKDRAIEAPGLGVRLAKQDINRFESKIIKEPSGCWIWNGYVRRDGYGEFSIDRKIYMSHRVSYSIYKGKLTPGLTLDHLCRTRKCVNPAHLEEVTNVENVLRGQSLPAKNAKKTHCALGHEYTPENTIHPKSNPTWRWCRICARLAKARSTRRKHVIATTADTNT